MSDQVDINRLDLDDEVVDIATDKSEAECEPPCEFVTGIAGTGKTHSVRTRAEEDSTYGMLMATTGIAAVNLGSITLHSALGLLPDSIEDDYQTGKLKRKLLPIALKHRRLLIDECSMLGGKELLDILYLAVKDVNGYVAVTRPLGITLIGDFAQLPPINQSWCFEADCWPKFEANTTRLTKNWRQSDAAFIDALNALRSGHGAEGARMAAQAGVSFHRQADPGFAGTTIVGTNDEVSRYNNLQFIKLPGARQTYKAQRTGKQRSEWLKNIPDQLEMKVGTLVMVLSNDTSKDPVTKEPLFRWVNGSMGNVVQMNAASVDVKLQRNGETHTIGYIARENGSKHPPDEFSEEDCKQAKKDGTPLPDGTYWDPEKRIWVRGTITYLPLRHGWATTVHKSQGLTLDNVQFDLRHHFVSKPSMVYVACSRARSPQGLHIVGNADMMTRRCQTDVKIARWL